MKEKGYVICVKYGQLDSNNKKLRKEVQLTHACPLVILAKHEEQSNHQGLYRTGLLGS